MFKRIMKSKFGAGIAEAAIALAVILVVSMGGITIIGAGSISNAKTEEYEYMRLAISNAFEYQKYAGNDNKVYDNLKLIYDKGGSMNKDGKYEFYNYSGVTIRGNYYTLTIKVWLGYGSVDSTFVATLTDRNSGQVVLKYDGYKRYDG